MSALLKDRVWVMLSEVAKRGVYPLHSSRLGLFRIPVDITSKADIDSIINDMKSAGFKIDTHADRIYITDKWIEKDIDKVTGEELSVELNVGVEIVTGEVVDVIYQVRPIEYFGDHYWIKNYRQKADSHAKMIIDTIIRNSKIGDKLLAHYQKAEKLSQDDAIKKLEQLTPLCKNPKQRTNVENKPLPQNVVEDTSKPVISASVLPPTGDTTISLTGSGTNHSKVDGPIDTGFKSQRQKVGKFQGISVWGPVDAPGQLGIWGDSVCVDFDICVADGACIEACPVNVYEWLDTPGHPASDKKPFMVREKDCIFCIACENVCPPQAIKIFQKGQ